MASKKNKFSQPPVFQWNHMPTPRTELCLYLIFHLFAILSSVNAESEWQKQQEWARKETESYVQKNPTITSERFVFKTIKLPDGSQLELDMQIERPEGSGPFPVVFFVHGGGWITGSKAHFCHQSFELAKNGIVGVRIEYRWMEHGGIYAHVIEDVLDAIDFVRKRKSDLQLDFDRVGLAGGSAGAHLSAIAAQLTPECICYDGFNGLYDLLNPDSSSFYGRKDFVGDSVEDKKKASAIYLLKDASVDTLLYHGSEDITIDIKQSYRLAHAIKQKGGNASVLAYEGVGHSFFETEPYFAMTTRALVDHVKHVFGMSEEKPDLSSYALPPQIAPVPSGFSVIGKWNQEEKPERAIEFKADFSMLFANQKVFWNETYGNYYVIWKGGTRTRIDILDWNRIKVAKDTYVRDSKVPSVVPAPPDLSKEWLRKRYEAIEAMLVKSDELNTTDVLFVGDSITQGWQEKGWEQWNQSFAGQPWKGLNLGVAGDRTENVLFRLQSKAEGGAGNMDDPAIQPKVIVLMIGTNNLFVHDPDQIMAGALACKNRLQQLAPQSRIVLCSVLPVKDQSVNENKVMPVNKLLKNMNMPPSAHWLDLYSHFVGDDGNQKADLFEDGVHLNASGYHKWHDLLVPLIAEIMTPAK
jgi:acetyl esterase/lipase/lysophospholipase L1-like esterase